AYALTQPVGANGLVNYVETRQLDKSPDGTGGNKRDYYFISRQFVDGLGRSLMTKQEAEPEGTGGPPRVVVNGALVFNARQKASRTVNPYFSRQGGSSLDDLLAYESIADPSWTGTFEDNGQLANLGLAAAHQSSMVYDATLRTTQATNPDGTFGRTVYEPLVPRTFDEKDVDPSSPSFNTPTIHFSHGLVRLIRVDETDHLKDDGSPASDPKTWTTTYAYDLNDRLTGITDSQGNVKTMTYDGLKRKTFMNDPDRGVVAYTYDA